MKRFRQLNITELFGNKEVKKLKIRGSSTQKSNLKMAEGVRGTGVRFIDDSQETSQNTPEEISENLSQESLLLNNILEISVSDSTDEDNSLEYLQKIPECCEFLPPLKPSSDHIIFFDINSEDSINTPFPKIYEDKWDEHHVRMPCSPQNLYPVEENGKMTLKNKWELIEKSLLSDISTSQELEDAILRYNNLYESQWDFSGLHDFFRNVLTTKETESFFKHILPEMVSLALQLPTLVTRSITLLERHKNQKLTFNQKQVGCLLANAFFCTYPRRNTKHRRGTDEYIWYPDINLNRLFIGTKKGIEFKRAEKLKCLINYFRRITSTDANGVITFHRVYIQEMPAWNSSLKHLKTLHVCSKGYIEKEGAGMLQVDFANKYVGGGVLGLGLVQEEIRFMLCPELILSRLFTERLDATEVLIVTGCEQFNDSIGYGNTFKWTGDFQDKTPCDPWKRRCTKVVAMDALHFRNEEDQYKISLVKRELNKAYTGFIDTEFDLLPAIATGNWGCGAFHGSPRLKSLIQLMAASECHRDIVYFTFGDRQLKRDIKAMYEFLKEKHITVGDLWKLLEEYSMIYSIKNNKVVPELYSFIYNVLSR